MVRVNKQPDINNRKVIENQERKKDNDGAIQVKFITKHWGRDVLPKDKNPCQNSPNFLSTDVLEWNEILLQSQGDSLYL